MTVLHVAHRAGNDLGLLAAATQGGADLVEADVHLRRGRLEVRHAKSLGPLPLLWEPWYLVRPNGLLLEQLAAALPGSAPVMLDLKGWQPWLGRRVRDAMARTAPGLPYTVCTRHWRMLDAFDGLDHVRVVHSARTPGELARLDARLARHPTWGACLHRDLLTVERVQRLRRRAEVVLSWPIDGTTYEEVVRLGVGAVITDELAGLPPVSRPTTPGLPGCP